MWGAIIAGGGASIVSGLLGQNAADAQADAANNATGLQREQYQTIRNDLTAYREAGIPAIQRLMYLTGTGANDGGSEFGSLTKDFSLADFAKDPGYSFRQSEGEKALGRAATATGNSGNTIGLKSLMRFNQDLASNEYGAAYGRFREQQSNKFNLLSYLAGTGQNAATQTGQAGINMASGAAQTMLAGGNAAAAGGAAWNNAIQGGLGNYMYQQRFDQMMKRLPVFGAANNSSFNSTGMTGGPGGTGDLQW